MTISFGSSREIVSAGLWIIAISLVIHLAFVGWQLAGNGSAFSVFSEIRLGMNRSEAESRLAAHNVGCIPDSDKSRCRFVDYWREYYIHFSVEDGRLHKKFFSFRRARRISDALYAR